MEDVWAATLPLAIEAAALELDAATLELEAVEGTWVEETSKLLDASEERA